MRKHEFLSELRESLEGHLNEAEIEEIVNDFTELFEAGAAEGKSEEDICKELGSPVRTAKSILLETTSQPISAANSAHPSASGQTQDPAAAHGETTLMPAPFHSRLLAHLIDWVLSVLPFAFFSIAHILPYMLFWPPVVFFTPVPFGEEPPVAAAVASMCYFVLYHPLFLILLRGKTPGKWLMRLEVVNLDGKPPGIGQALGREWIGRLLLVCVTFGISNLVSLFWCIFSKQHKTVHDAASNTIVISSRSAADRSAYPWTPN